MGEENRWGSARGDAIHDSIHKAHLDEGASEGLAGARLAQPCAVALETAQTAHRVAGHLHDAVVAVDAVTLVGEMGRLGRSGGLNVG